MRSDWFFPQRLARRLARHEVGNREVAYLMVANLLFGLVVFYGAFTWANPPWTLLSLLEGAVVVVVTLIGFTKCYDAAGGDTNDRFAAQFNCLSFGAWVWATVVAWVVFWAVVWAFRAGMFASVEYQRWGIATNLAAVGGSFGWLWAVLAAVLWQVAYFSFLRRSLQTANAAAEPLGQVDVPRRASGI